MKPRLFRENVDTIIGHKFPTWKLTIERKSLMSGHPYKLSLFDGIGPMPWNLACFEKTLTPELDINFQSENQRWKENPLWLVTLTGPLHSMELVPDPETSHVSRKRWTRIGHKLPVGKSTTERKPFMIGHHRRSHAFDVIGPRSWNLACFEKTFTPELDITFQSEKQR